MNVPYNNPNTIGRRLAGIFKNFLPRSAEQDNAGNFWYYIYDSTMPDSDGVPARYDEGKALLYAMSIAEVFYPIDAIADRVSALPFKLVDATTRKDIEHVPENVARLLKQPNFMTSFEELLYATTFYELATGNNFLYTKVPKQYANGFIDANSISAIWALRPDAVSIKTKQTRPKLLDCTHITDIVEHYTYSLIDKEILDPNYVVHERSFQPFSGIDGSLFSASPMSAAKRSIETLLAVYEARRKVYTNNGMAGILSQAAMGANQEMQELINPKTRDEMVQDITNRNGLIGDKRLWTVVPYPVQFTKTLATIKELEPFEETAEDSLKIASIYGLDKDLVPLKEGTTFSNKEIAERNLYANVIKSVAEYKGKSISKAMNLYALGMELVPDATRIAALSTDSKTSNESDKILLENIEIIQRTGYAEEADLRSVVTNLVNKYKDEQ